MRHQRLDERVEVAVNEICQIVERDFDAMIRDTVLRKIVGADFLAAFAGADLVFAVRGVFCVFLGDFRSSRRERKTVIAWIRFFCCERWSAHRTIMPGRFVDDLHG